MQIEDFLSRLSGAKKSGRGYVAKCPCHDDGTASLSINEGDDGRILLKCFANCPTEAIVNSLGVEMKDLFPKKQRGGGVLNPPQQHCNAASPEGCTLKEYAAAKNLPEDFLTDLGLREISYIKKPAVRIPYMDEKGDEISAQFRLSMTGDRRMVFKRGSHAYLYGLSRLPVDSKYIVLAEGPSDTQTLWFNEFPAVGLPGASMFTDRILSSLQRFNRIYVIIEPDQGGQAVREAIGKSSLRDRVWLVYFTEFKDPSDLYLHDSAGFKARFQRLLDDAVPWTEIDRKEREEKAAEAWKSCRVIAESPYILDLFASKLPQVGVVGEDRICKTIYLAMTARLFDRIPSIGVKGPSSGGKSFIVETVCRFFPSSSHHTLSGMSEHALAYSEEPLSHRFLIIYEAVGLLTSDLVSYLVRSLLSEGKIRYETVLKGPNGMEPKIIEKEGPTGLIITTTLTSVHAENETRMISLTVNDTADQTKAILRAIAKEKPDPDLSEWLNLQIWLESDEHRVCIPYINILAEMIPPVAVRLRRDFTSLLSLIKAHALLHRATRERDPEGRILASFTDYGVVRDLASAFISEGVGAIVSAAVRETVQAVEDLLSDQEEDEGGKKKEPATTSTRKVAEKLGLDKSAASRRIKQALDAGYLVNIEDKKGRPFKILLGDPLPDQIDLLPTAEKLQEEVNRCSVASDLEGIKNPPSPLPVDQKIQRQRILSEVVGSIMDSLMARGKSDAPEIIEADDPEGIPF